MTIVKKIKSTIYNILPNSLKIKGTLSPEDIPLALKLIQEHEFIKEEITIHPNYYQMWKDGYFQEELQEEFQSSSSDEGAIINE
jgi:hypothetical protein